MPFLPIVPHIVGDDDESNEVNEQADVSNGSSRISARRASSRSVKTIDSESSDDESESSFDDNTEADSEDSKGSTADEEDWSNNISYIVRTPEHESELDSTMTVSAPIKSEDVEISVDLVDENSTDNLQPDHNQPMDLSADFKETQSSVDSASNQTNSELVESKELSSPMDDDEHVSDAVPPSPSSMISSVDNDSQKDEKTTRRKSLRSAYRTTLVKSVLLSKKSATGRQRNSGNNNGKMSDSSIAARVAKRFRSSVVLNRSPIAKKSCELARPLEMTEYFTKISATLVRHRVHLLPFLHMRKRIDRMVGEAIAKTKISKKMQIK